MSDNLSFLVGVGMGLVVVIAIVAMVNYEVWVPTLRKLFTRKSPPKSSSGHFVRVLEHGAGSKEIEQILRLQVALKESAYCVIRMEMHDDGKARFNFDGAKHAWEDVDAAIDDHLAQLEERASAQAETLAKNVRKDKPQSYRESAKS